MCGICGVVSISGVVVDRELPSRMIAAIRHRGPDDTGIYLDSQVALGHARLSIIDLSGGHQPMAEDQGGLWITFNGEIFNYIELAEELTKKGHRFSTQSDTEVILHLYQEEGERCVNRLNGQWSFAIWDSRKRKLFLSRDRLGVRPLYYTRTKNHFLFASEIKALLECPEVHCTLDTIALDQIFTFWFPLPPRTAFKDILQLPPGHSMTVQDGTIRVWRFWDIEYSPPDQIVEGAEALRAEELLGLLQDATRIRLRSDVPVGAYLSGGLDSTLIAALAKNVVTDRLRTFSVGFEDAAFDESGYQLEASAFLRTEHSRIHCSYKDIANVFDEVIWHSEQPILRTAPAPMYLLSKLVRDSGYKVVLTGEGADETLGGYDIFKEGKIRRFWARNPDSMYRPLILKRLYPYMEDIQRQPSAYLQRFFHINPDAVASPFFSHLPRWELTSKLKMFLSDAVQAETRSRNSLSELAQLLPCGYSSWSHFNQAEYLEAMYLLPGYILSSQGDRMAMANSIESRHPFLDYRVVEFAARLPVNLKMKVLDEKYLLKRAAAGLIPDSIHNRPKQPYRAPDGKCFFLSSDQLSAALCPDQIKRTGIFDPQRVSALVAKFKSGRASGTRDNMALVGILSTQVLLTRFSFGSRLTH